MKTYAHGHSPAKPGRPAVRATPPEAQAPQPVGELAQPRARRQKLALLVSAPARLQQLALQLRRFHCREQIALLHFRADIHI